MFNKGVAQRIPTIYFNEILPHKKKKPRNEVFFHFYLKEGVCVEIKEQNLSVFSKIRQTNIRNRKNKSRQGLSSKSKKIESNEKINLFSRKPDFSVPLYCFSTKELADFIEKSKLVRSRKYTLSPVIYSNVLMNLQEEDSIVDFFYNKLIQSQIPIYFEAQENKEDAKQTYLMDIIQNNYEKLLEKGDFSTIEDLYKQVLFLARAHYKEDELWKFGVECPTDMPQDLIPTKVRDIKFNFN